MHVAGVQTWSLQISFDMIAVPFAPTKPAVSDVEIVITGVVVGVATEPAKLFAEATDTLVTVPVVGVVQIGAVDRPCDVST